MTYKGRSIWEYYPPRSGIRYGHPVVEESLAAIWANHKPDEFALLPIEERATTIALYRTHHQVEAVVADDHRRSLEKNTSSSR